MSKLEKYLDELLIFMADEIEKNAGTTKTIEFNFSFEFIEKYFNADDENVEKYIRVSEKPLSQRKLTNDEINHFKK